MAHGVESAEVVYGCLDNIARRLVLGHGIEVCDRRAAFVTNFLCRLLCWRAGRSFAVHCAAQVVSDHGRTVVGHPVSDFAPDTPASSGNDYDSAFHSISH